MALNMFNIKKWAKMLMGKSILHLEQGVGLVYSKTHIEGYYNDLTKKVTEDVEILHTDLLPKNKIKGNKKVYFPTQIFQYGLGCYDLYLLTKDLFYLNKFKKCVEWAYDNIDEEGRWNNFYFVYPDYPYCAMAQGEGVSLLLRAYIQYGEDKYLTMATKAINFMVISIDNGGVCKYEDEDVFFIEFTNKPFIFNGGIFALWGLYDYLKIKNDTHLQQLYDKAVKTLVKNISKFDNGYWSMYDIKNKIASPFYHKLHISQLKVMYDITGIEDFIITANKFEAYKLKWWNRKRAFIKKAFQKVIEKV